MQRMGKLERYLKKPERILLYVDVNPVEIRNNYVGRVFLPSEEVQAPVFKIEKIVGEKRKRVIAGNASDYVLDY